MKPFVFLFLLGAFLASPNFPNKAEAASPAAESAEKKLAYIQQNGESPKPNTAPTAITEQEMNAYLASGMVRFPPGVESLRLEGDGGNIVGRARVDFDKVRAGTRNPSPLLSLFSGVHDVVVTANGRGFGGQGQVQVDKVWFDGSEIPRFLVQMFVEKYLAPKYPGVGMNSKFALPSRIDSAVVGKHLLTVVQK
jgi:hypothetical protein